MGKYWFIIGWFLLWCDIGLTQPTAAFIQKNYQNNKLRLSISRPALVLEALPENYFKAHVEVNEQKLKSKFVKVKIEGLPHSFEAGAPELPFISLLLEGRPEDFNIQTFNSEKNQPEILAGHMPVPAPKWPCRCKDERPQWIFNQNAYQQVTPLYKLEYMGDFQGIPLTRMLLYPIGYRPEVGLELRHQTQLEISYQHKAKTSSNRVQVYTAFELLKLPSRPFQVQQTKRMVVMTPAELADDVMELVQWKKDQGLEVEVWLLEDLGVSSESIAQSIQQKYTANPFQYALIVGHEDLFPTHYVETVFDAKTPSDWPYFVMGAKDDRIPDVYYGRLVVDNASELKQQLSKWKQFHLSRQNTRTVTTPFMIGIASDEGENPTDGEYLEQMMRPLLTTFNWQGKRFLQGDAAATADNLVLAFNQGPLWLNYIGHGSGSSWPSLSGRAFESQDLLAVDQQSVWPIVIDVACQNGRFAVNGNYLGERLVNEQNEQGKLVGATAYYGGSVNISWHPPAIMAVGINRFLEAQTAPVSLGQALWAGHLYLSQNYDVPQDLLENWQWYHLQGDPSLMIHTGLGQ